MTTDHVTSTTGTIPKASLTPEQRAAYPAAQRLLDEAADAAISPMPVWRIRGTIEYTDSVLELPSGCTLRVAPWQAAYSATACVLVRVDASTGNEAKSACIRPLIAALELAMADLRAMAASESEVQP